MKLLQKQKKEKVNNRPNYIPLKRIKIVHRPLGREAAYAQVYKEDDNYIIEIDDRQTEKELLGSYCHELFHGMLPDLSESDILKMEKTIGNYLWSLGYRRVNLK